MDESLFISKYPDRFECPICLGFVQDPIEHVLCDQIFCRGCLKKTRLCPTCRGDLGSLNIKSLNRYLRQDYSEIKLRCCNHSQGCTEICTMGNIQEHLRRCSFELVKCRHFGCQTQLKKRDMREHDKECLFRLVDCSYCKFPKMASEIQIHHSTDCPKYPQLCKYGCQVRYSRDQKETHKIHCSKFPTKCKLCGVSLLREQLLLHETATCHMRVLCCRYCEEALPCAQLSQHVCSAGKREKSSSNLKTTQSGNVNSKEVSSESSGNPFSGGASNPFGGSTGAATGTTGQLFSGAGGGSSSTTFGGGSSSNPFAPAGLPSAAPSGPFGGSAAPFSAPFSAGAAFPNAFQAPGAPPAAPSGPFSSFPTSGGFGDSQGSNNNLPGLLSGGSSASTAGAGGAGAGGFNIGKSEPQRRILKVRRKPTG